jgi:hypothetical protein
MSLWDRHSTKQCDPLSCWYCLHPEHDYYCNLYFPENWQAKKRKERRVDVSANQRPTGGLSGSPGPESLTKAPNSPVEPLSEGE